MRNPNAVDVGEIIVALPRARDESVAIRVLHLEMRRKVLRRGCKLQNRTVLICFPSKETSCGRDRG